MQAARRQSGSGREWLGLAGFLLACFGAAAIGGAFTSSSVGSWYQTLSKPSFNPPSWVFGPVWTVLYAMMAVAAWRVWRQRGFSGAPAALALFGVQLVLNLGWSLLFFGARMPGAAFAEIVVLWGAILLTTLAFFRIDRPAGWMMVPYLAWVSFASVLNFAIWQMNG
jgi:tryptophan-rich sensory protein